MSNADDEPRAMANVDTAPPPTLNDERNGDEIDRLSMSEITESSTSEIDSAESIQDKSDALLLKENVTEQENTTGLPDIRDIKTPEYMAPLPPSLNQISVKYDTCRTMSHASSDGVRIESQSQADVLDALEWDKRDVNITESRLHESNVHPTSPRQINTEKKGQTYSSDQQNGQKEHIFRPIYPNVEELEEYVRNLTVDCTVPKTTRAVVAADTDKLCRETAGNLAGQTYANDYENGENIRTAQSLGTSMRILREGRAEHSHIEASTAVNDYPGNRPLYSNAATSMHPAVFETARPSIDCSLPSRPYNRESLEIFGTRLPVGNDQEDERFKRMVYSPGTFRKLYEEITLERNTSTGVKHNLETSGNGACDLQQNRLNFDMNTTRLPPRFGENQPTQDVVEEADNHAHMSVHTESTKYFETPHARQCPATTTSVVTATGASIPTATAAPSVPVLKTPAHFACSESLVLGEHTPPIIDFAPLDAVPRPTPRPVVSETAICPKTFEGVENMEEAEAWISYLTKYVNFKNFTNVESLQLAGLLLQRGASAWFDSLPIEKRQTYVDFVNAFKEAYCLNPNMAWKQLASLFSSPMRNNESVTAFVSRLRKTASQVPDVSESVFLSAVIAGLLPHLRINVLNNGVTNLQEVIDLARRVEACTGSDPLTTVLMDSLKSSNELMQKQSQDIKALTSQVQQMAAASAAAISQPKYDGDVSTIEPPRSSQQAQQQIHASGQGRVGNYQRTQNQEWKGMRTQRFNPRNQQRMNYVRDYMQQQSQGQNSQAADTTVCPSCSLHHRRAGVCPSKFKQCYSCGAYGHYSRCCMAARNQQH